MLHIFYFETLDLHSVRILSLSFTGIYPVLLQFQHHVKKKNKQRFQPLDLSSFRFDYFLFITVYSLKLKIKNLLPELNYVYYFTLRRTSKSILLINWLFAQLLNECFFFVCF